MLRASRTSLALLPTRAAFTQTAGMSTLTKARITVRKSASSKSANAKKAVPAWIGSGVGKAFVRPSVDLAKPTLPPGKYL